MIKVCEPFLALAERGQVVDCLAAGHLAQGPHINAFEEGWANYCGRTHGVAVCNGTAALQLALEALGLQPGDEVIMPSFTIISCALAIIRSGAKIVVADVDDAWNIDPAGITSLITPRTRAILVVHTYGQPANMAAIEALASAHHLTIIEDAAEAHGAEINGRKCGSFGLMGCFSFYSNKIITTGEGGMILTDDAKLAERLKNARNLCFGIGDDRFTHVGLGHNFRLTNLQAAIGCAQLNRIEHILMAKQEIGHQYRQRFKNISGITLQHELPDSVGVYWMNGILVPNARSLAKILLDEGIETRPFFTGMHRQPTLGLDAKCPVTDVLSEHGLYLPSGLNVTPAQVNRICDLVVVNLWK